MLVFVSRFVGPAPMDLVFSPTEVLAVFLAAWIAAQICSDGVSTWVEGAQLLAVYAILAIAFLFPAGLENGSGGGPRIINEDNVH